VTADEVASWQPPTWATAIRLTDSGVIHTRSRSVSGLPSDRDEETSAEVHLVQLDGIDVTDDGRVQVKRRAPLITIEDLRFSLQGAADLRDVLGELLALAEGRLLS
jgi:hypothetical protein